jgi:hypothetical protein
LERFDRELSELAALAQHVEQTVGRVVAGAVVGRTRIRDEVVRFLGISQLEAEELVDTMVVCGFLVLQSTGDGWQYWRIIGSPEAQRDN